MKREDFTHTNNRYAPAAPDKKDYLDTESYFDMNGKQISIILHDDDSLIKEDALDIEPKLTKSKPVAVKSTPAATLPPHSNSSNGSNGSQRGPRSHDKNFSGTMYGTAARCNRMKSGSGGDGRRAEMREYQEQAMAGINI